MVLVSTKKMIRLLPRSTMNKPKNLNISRRLFLAFGMLILLYAAFSFHYFTAMEKMSGVIKTIYEHPLVVSNGSLQSPTTGEET